LPGSKPSEQLFFFLVGVEALCSISPRFSARRRALFSRGARLGVDNQKSSMTAV
jgi:hypothetical protein